MGIKLQELRYGTKLHEGIQAQSLFNVAFNIAANPRTIHIRSQIMFITLISLSLMEKA